jgi:hypothetical protein
LPISFAISETVSCHSVDRNGTAARGEHSDDVYEAAMAELAFRSDMSAKIC